jgi:hypothetical protein
MEERFIFAWDNIYIQGERGRAAAGLRRRLRKVPPP